jgi:hypothetical protein
MQYQPLLPSPSRDSKDCILNSEFHPLILILAILGNPCFTKVGHLLSVALSSITNANLLVMLIPDCIGTHVWL